MTVYLSKMVATMVGSTLFAKIRLSEKLRIITVSCCCCVGVLRPFDTFQVISCAVSKPIYTVPWQDSYVVNQYLVHILLPVTDNCPS